MNKVMNRIPARWLNHHFDGIFMIPIVIAAGFLVALKYGYTFE
jgi:hypothetical protein